MLVKINVEGIILCIFVVVYILFVLIVNRSGLFQSYLNWVLYILFVIFCGFVLVVVVCLLLENVDFSYVESFYLLLDGVWLIVFFVYMIYIMLLVRMRIVVFGGCFFFVIYLILSVVMNSNDMNFIRLVSIFLIFCFWFICVLLCVL